MGLRFDTGSIGKTSRTPQGGLRADAVLTRTGVFTYHTPNGPVREYRSPEEVFSPASLATLLDAPVTDRHPDKVKHGGVVTPKNFKELSVGLVSGQPRQDGSQLAATLVIQDAGALEAIETRSRREISCGYSCETVGPGGVTPDGDRYDVAQTNIVYNHVAIVERGRAGAECALRLDAAGDEILPAEVQVTPEQIAKLQADLAAANARADKAEGEREVALTQVTTEKARADAASSPASVKAAVAARLALESSARKVLGAEIKLDTLDDSAVRLAVVAKAFPAVSLEGKSPEYIAPLYDAAIAAGASAPAPRADNLPEVTQALGLTPPPAAVAPGQDKSRADAAQKAREKNLARGKAPLSLTKGK